MIYYINKLCIYSKHLLILICLLSWHIYCYKTLYKKGGYILLILFYLFLWIILCENYRLETLLIGLIVSAFVYFYNKELNTMSTNNPRNFLKKVIYLIYYILILTKDIAIANLQVAKIVLSKDIRITPKIVSYITPLKTDLYRTILANSITLTPGTLTISLDDNLLTIHCLDEKFIYELFDSKFEKTLMKVEALSNE